MLRAAARQLIASCLDESFFGHGNFNVRYTDGNPNIFSIEFIPNRQFKFFLANSTNDRGPRLVCREAPGEQFLGLESFLVAEMSDVYERLEGWLWRIHEETVSDNPLAHAVDEMNAYFETRMNEMAQEMDGFFTASEAQELRTKLAAFADRIETLEDGQSQTQETIAKLEKMIGELMDATSQVGKATWYRMAGSKLVSSIKFFSKSKDLQKFVLETAKLLLPRPDGDQ